MAGSFDVQSKVIFMSVISGICILNTYLSMRIIQLITNYIQIVFYFSCLHNMMDTSMYNFLVNRNGLVFKCIVKMREINWTHNLNFENTVTDSKNE